MEIINGIQKCEKCGRVKDWKGDDMKCAFDDNGFKVDNWRCGALLKLRQLILASDIQPVQGFYYAVFEGQSSSLIDVSEIEFDSFQFSSLWTTWYKKRGGTDSMWLLSNYQQPARPTLKDIQKILKYYNQWQ